MTVRIADPNEVKSSSRFKNKVQFLITSSYFSKLSAAVIAGLDGTELILKCCRSRKIILGIIFSATHIKSADGSGGGTRRWPWCWVQNPDSFITDESPQSQAPPAWLLNMLKSWPAWFVRCCLKHSLQRDIHWEIPQVRHLNATKSAVQTRPHRAVLSYWRTFWEKSS